MEFKTVSFGGYDKKAVDTYIEESEANYEKEITELRANAEKLADTVKSLQTMRDVNMNESKETIDNLKSVNEKLESEIEHLKEELKSYREKEGESAARYESISRTLLAAQELGRKSIGFELNPEYIKLINKKLYGYTSQLCLFNE